MKDDMSGFDLRAVCNELQDVGTAWVKKAYMPHYEQVVLRMNPKGKDGFDIVLVRGERIYTSRRDRPMPMVPPAFAMLLRKHLKNARLEKIEQLGFDRILKFTFDSKFGPRFLYTEAFNNGNIILCDENDVIIQPITHVKYKDRVLKKGEVYTPPPPSLDPTEVTEKQLDEILTTSEKNIAATLASELNLGGKIAKELCTMCGIDPKSESKEVTASSILPGLKKLLDSLQNRDSAYLIFKGDSEVNQEDLSKEIASRCVEATPILLPSHEGAISFKTDSMCRAVDLWKGEHDSQAHERREMEKLDFASPGRGYSTPVEKLERRLQQQKSALAKFDKKIAQQQKLGHAIQNEWSHVESLIEQINAAVDQNGWDSVKKTAKEIVWISSLNSKDKIARIFLPDESGEPGIEVEVDLTMSVYQNAQTHFQSAQKQKDKTKGARDALEDTERLLKTAKKKESKSQTDGRVIKIKRSKRLWFERFKYSIMSDNKLLVGGKDAKSNDGLVKKHLKADDMYLHADLHGAPSCALQSIRGFEIDENPLSTIPPGVPAFRLSDKMKEITPITDDLLEEAAQMAICWSRAWQSGKGHGTVYAVKPGQVSKTAQTGEYIGKGAFIVRGQRKWFKDLDMKIGIGLVSVNNIVMIIAGTPNVIKEKFPRYAILSHGMTKKETVANQISKFTGLPTDDILPSLPGNLTVEEEFGMLSKYVTEEE